MDEQLAEHLCSHKTLLGHSGMAQQRTSFIHRQIRSVDSQSEDGKRDSGGEPGLGVTELGY